MTPQTIPTLYLASSSPRRQELMRGLNLPFVIRPSGADERVDPGLAPAGIVETLARRKAESVRDELRQAGETGIVIGSDTIVVLDGQVLGKPADDADAERMLGLLQGRTHQVYSGIACLEIDGPREAVSHRVTDVTMRPLGAEEIRAYVATGEPADKAGAYAIQGIGATLVDGIRGDYFNVVGLSVALLAELLRSFGVDVLRHQPAAARR